jgi:predicted O-linked N-acetylglucosamine transferase (SPINDLY family)
VTFGSFSGGQKYNAMLLDLWSKVLHRVPNSRLRLQNNQLKNADTRRLITSRFERLGIAPERVAAVAGLDRASLLKQYREMDICLDTWPYSGGLSISEPLWQGVPVIGYYGKTFRDRYGAGLLAAAGCSNLVAKSFEEYVDIAAELASDSERLRTLRYSLRDMCTKYGLNDSVGMARCLEAAYREMISKISAT